ncbi:MAG TPA: molybdopterin-guanine dinucleotide biosynthesis protein B [Stellaceae bacterium]|jgi:molybdopterin-guanine dinucleotide biosynthesis protein B|nr:molybdopterin-guanine dinucleotide biosynthesis protein B [Stellaceae bacterium]
MKVFGLAGWSGSGKTTLMTRLLPALLHRGVSVSTIKHAHHEFDVDQPGKDSYRHREAGATEVMISSENRWALMHELRGGTEPPLAELLSHMSPVDLVIVEGFKRTALPKLEVHRPSVGKPLLAPDDSDIVAIATDVPVIGLGALPRFALDDIGAIADFIINHLGMAVRGRGAAQ